MNILGIDPGIERTGWAVIYEGAGHLKVLDYSVIETKKTQAQEKRLLAIYKAILDIVTRLKPDCAVVEELFFAKNVKTALPVGEARGIILLAAATKDVPVVSYTPRVVKQTITGSGAADKMQVQKMVTKLLKLPSLPTPDDVADALAIALTHAYSYRVKEKLR